MVTAMSPKDLNDLGDQYFYGRGKEKNIEVAFTYYKRAADQNNPVGLANVGKYFLAKKDAEVAFDYFEKASELKYPLAFIKMSEMYLNGVGVKRNKKKAFKALEEAVKLNEIEAYHLLGTFYLNGIGVGKNEVKAYELFLLSAQSDNTEGMFLLGELLLNAKSIKNDYETAFFYLDKAAVNNNVNALVYLKDLYQVKHVYLKKKSELYLKEMWFYYDEILANLDDVEALKRCAFTYYNGGETTKINFEKAMKYFKILYNLDVTEGYLGMGLSYMYGQGVQIDIDRAKDYLEIAANRGNSKAKNALGDLFRLGKGVDTDYSVARDFYVEAAKDNDVDALINLGLLHYRKQIKNHSDTLAYQFMTKASEFDNPSAYYWLGIFQEKGIGCSSSFDHAIKSFEKAIEKGNIGAKYKLASMMYDMTVDSKIPKKKIDKNFVYIKTLLIEYIQSPLSQEVNALYSMYLLGDLFRNTNFSEYSIKASRYWFEVAAEKGYSKAMVRIYEILKDKEPRRAYYWLSKAIEKPSDGEELYQMSLVFESGLLGIMQDKVKAHNYLRLSAELNYKPAVLKLTMPNKN